MKRLAARAAWLVAFVLAAVLIVHAPPVRRAALGYAIDTLQERFQLRITAARLDYNLAALRVGLSDVKVAALATPDTPFFEATYASATLARSALFGALEFDEVSIDGGRVRVLRTAAGSNLPPGDSGGGEPPSLPIARMLAPGLVIEARDEPAAFALVVPALSVDLSRRAGRLSIDTPATLSFAGRSTRVSRFAGQASFDGRRIQLSRVEAVLDEAQLAVAGSLALLVAQPALDLAVRGTGALAALAAWGMADTDTPRGSLAFEGRVAGPFSTPAADLRLAAEEIQWQGLPLKEARADVRVTAAATEIRSGQFTLARGVVSMNGRIAYDGGSASLLDASWQAVDTSELAAAFAADAAVLPAGPASGRLTARGQAGEPDSWTIDGGVRIESVANRPRRVALPGRSSLRFAAGSWQIDGEHRVGNIAPAVVAVRIGSGDPMPLSGTVRIEATDVPPLLAALRELALVDADLSIVESGTLSGDIALAGSVTAPTFRASGTVAGGRIGGQAVGDIRASGQFNADTEAYQLDVTLAPSALLPTGARPLRGTVTGELHGAGTLDAPRGGGVLSLVDAVWSDVPVGGVDTYFQLDDSLLRAVTSVPRFQATMTTGTALTAPYRTTIAVVASDVDLAAVAAHLQTMSPIRGTASLTASGEGPLEAWRTGTASVNLTALEATVGSLPIRLDDPALVTYADGRIRLVQAAVSAGAARLAATGALPLETQTPAAPGDGLVLTAGGDVGEIAGALDATGLVDVPILGGSGPASLVARVTGSVVAPVFEADVEVGPASVAVEGLPLITALRVSAHLSDDSLELRSGSARYQGAQATASGIVPLAWFRDAAAPSTTPARVTARVLNITPAFLDPFVEQSAIDELAGTVDVSVDLQSPVADVAALRGEVRIDRMDLRIADLPVTQVSPTRIVAQDGFARIESWEWQGQGANLAVRGQVRLRDLQAGILANGELDLRMLTPFVRASGLTTTGRLIPRLSITGRLDEPRVDGDITIDSGELRVNDPRVLVSNVTARAVLSRTSAQITALTGSINGGELTGAGEIRVEGERVSAALAASIGDMALEFPEGLRTALNANLTIDLEQLSTADAMPSGRVGGTVTVLRGSYREPLAVVGGLLAAVRAPVVTGVSSSPMLEALALDVRVLTDSDIEVNNNTARLQVGGDLRVTGTAAAPGVSGRADLQPGGRVFLGRNSYEIVSGRIDFADPFTVRPELALELTTRAGGEDIDVSLSGSVDNPSVALSSSNPDLTQADLTALLVTGRRFDQLASADAAMIGDVVVGNLAGDVLGFAGRAVGLDTLRLGNVATDDTRRDPTAVATETDPTSRLTFGRSFGPDLDVTLSQSLRRGDAQTWIVDYAPLRGLLLRLVSNDDDLRAYEFRHDIAIGGPPRVRSANVSRQPDVRIVAVRVEGTLAVPKARVRDLLQHDAGERFDFGAWQDDRDRLERFYREQNRLTARIASSRVVQDDGVALVYVIQAGPETRIVVSGATMTDAVVERVRNAWAASILDDVFLTEVTDIVTSALVDEGYLRPRVRPSFDELGDVRTLTIDVEAGTRTRDLRVVVTAPDDAVARDLDAWAGEAGRARQAMRDPAGFEAAATALLRERGFVTPTVSVGAVRLEGETAMVPVTVATGLALAIGAVRFEGATLAPAILIDAASLDAGTPLEAGAVSAARDRVMALYRREGFPDAAIEVRQARVADTARVDVVFAVVEGARQTIVDLRVGGNRRTDTDVITRALRLATGQALRSEEIVQGRRRLFDTGLFRRVDVTTEAAEGSGRPVVVRVVVEEWPALRIRYGLGATEERPDDDLGSRNLVGGVYADATRRTLLGRAIATGVAARYQPRDRMARVFLNSPTLLSLPVESSLALERTREEFTSASLVTDITAISWGQRTRPAERLELSYAYRFERNRTYDTDPTPGSIVVFDETVKVARFTGSAVWDSRNTPADATRGLFLAGTVEWGPQSIGSDFRFAKQLTQAYHFMPWRGLVLASAARFGVVVPLGGQDVLLSERFFAGGARTVRGVEEDGLGDRDFFGPLGGQAMLLLNQEVRFPIYRWVRGVGFVDAGNVFAQPRDLSFGQLTASIGAGLRLTTPFAVLRADYGHVPKSGQGRWTFGIGHAF